VINHRQVIDPIGSRRLAGQMAAAIECRSWVVASRNPAQSPLGTS